MDGKYICFFLGLLATLQSFKYMKFSFIVFFVINLIAFQRQQSILSLKVIKLFKQLLKNSFYIVNNNTKNNLLTFLITLFKTFLSLGNQTIFFITFFFVIYFMIKSEYLKVNYYKNCELDYFNNILMLFENDY